MKFIVTRIMLLLVTFHQEYNSSLPSGRDARPEKERPPPAAATKQFPQNARHHLELRL